MLGSPLTNFSNVTSLPPSSPQQEALVDPVVLRLLRIVFYGVISIVGAIGNTLVILAYRNPRMRSVTNLFIANLGVADLTVSLINAPVTVTSTTLEYWPFGLFLCKSINYLLGVTVFCSAGTLMAIAVDRYRAIVHPLLPRIRTRHAIMIIAAIWTAAFIFPIPLIIYQKLENSGRCIEVWPSDEANGIFTVAVAVALYLIPLIVISVLYFLICHNLNTSQSTAQAGSSRTRKSVIRMLVIVVVLFTICMLPFHVSTLYINFKGPGSGSMKFQIVMFSIWLMLANSCCNPLVYAVLNRNYRREFVRLLRCQSFSLWYRNAESTYDRDRRFSSDTRTILRTNPHFSVQNGKTQETTCMTSRTGRGNYSNESERCSMDVERPVICADSRL